MLSQFQIMVRWAEWGSGQILYGHTLGGPPTKPISLLACCWYQRQTPEMCMNHLHLPTLPHIPLAEVCPASLENHYHIQLPPGCEAPKDGIYECIAPQFFPQYLVHCRAQNSEWTNEPLLPVGMCHGPLMRFEMYCTWQTQGEQAFHRTAAWLLPHRCSLAREFILKFFG